MLALAAVIAGAVLRLWNLGEGSIAHPEIYIPNIPLPPGVSSPPPRFGFLETLAWHFADEPHPPGYYMAMWAWTKLVGTSPVALRLPACLIGIASIGLTWGLAARIFDRRVAAIAALFVALNGFDIYWSRMARMYVPGGALAVGSSWALVELVRSDRPRRGLELAYVIMLIAGTQTFELFWAIPMLHLAWAAWVFGPDKLPEWRQLLLAWKAPTLRLVQLQAIALALASPEFIHAALQARHGAAPDPAPRFLLEYAGFGFLFETDPTTSAFPIPPIAIALALAMVSLGLVAASLRAPAASIGKPDSRALPFRTLALASIAGSAMALFLASIASRHREILACFALLPILCAWLPGLALLARPLISRLAPPVARWVDKLNPFVVLLVLLALVPPLAFYAGSVKMSVLATRAFLPFTPFLLVLVAAGLLATVRLPSIQGVAIGGLMALFATSTFYFHSRPQSPRDYKLLDAILAREWHPGDVILVRKQQWADTPIFYYLPNAPYLAEDERAFISAHWPPRIWLPHWIDELGAVRHDHRDDILAESGYSEVREWHFKGGKAMLFAFLPNAGRSIASQREGYDVVRAVRCRRDADNWFKRSSARGFYAVISRMAGIEITPDAGDFRLMDRRVVSAVTEMRERTRFMKGLFAWVGFNTIDVEYDRPERAAGKTKFGFWRLWNLALDGITGFSTFPLRAAGYLRALVAMFAFFYGLFLVVRTLIFGVDEPGYASLEVSVLFVSGVQLVVLGTIGEYLGRVYGETRRRPLYLVMSTLGVAPEETAEQ